MTPQELKMSILQLAFEGKLTTQDSNEILNSDYLNKIKLVKQNSGFTSKKYKNINDVEKPFDIPSNWSWIYLSDLCAVTGGYAFSSASFKEKGVRVVRISDFNENGFVNNKIVRTDYCKDLDPYKINAKDILLCMTGGTVGKSYFVKAIDEDMFTNQRVATIKILSENKEFINYVIMAPFTQKVIQHSKNSTNDNISMDTINTFLIPFPPLEEQKRIVAKIEELLPLVDRYEEAWNKLETLNNKFPLDLEKSLLQLAVQGKLVEQRKEEGTGEELFNSIQEQKQILIKERKIKKEKSLSLINEDEIPFEIPQSWKWCRISSLVDIINGFTPLRSEESFWKNGTINWMTVEDINSQGKYLESTVQHITDKAVKSLDRIVPANSVFICCTSATIGKVAINKVPMSSNQQFNGLKNKLEVGNNLFVEYLYWYAYLLKPTLIKIAGVTTFPFVSVDKLGKLLIPLPPFEEQKRIVAKLEELLTFVKKLK